MALRVKQVLPVGCFVAIVVYFLGGTRLLRVPHKYRELSEGRALSAYYDANALTGISESDISSHDPVKLNETRLRLLSALHHVDGQLSGVRFTPPPPEEPDSTPDPDSVAPDAVRTWRPGDAVGLTVNDLPNVTVADIDCNALFESDLNQLDIAKKHQEANPKVEMKPEAYELKTNSCRKFVRERGYAVRPFNEEEANFPLAFTILMFKDIEQFERLLRAIYRPQNIYCVHVDKKSPQPLHSAVQSIARCFANVFVLTPSIDVSWGSFTVLEPELVCMKELLRRSKRWKYFINLTGQEFPLKTNWQIVQILKAFNGSNNLEGTLKRRNMGRFDNKMPPPVNATITKGSVHIAVKRAFVDYVVNNEVAKKFLDWVKDTSIPDETFFSSLNHSPQLGVPGSYLGEPETDGGQNRFLARFKNWGDGPFNYPCGGQRVSMVCIFSIQDLALLASRPELFANKFYLTYEPLALDCMEQLHFKRVRDEVIAGSAAQFDVSLYVSQKFVHNHL